MRSPRLVRILTPVLLSCFALSAHAQALSGEVVPLQAPVGTAQNALIEAKKSVSVVTAVRRGRKMLQDILAERLKKAKQPYSVPNGMTAKITLAVWDRGTDEITVVEATKSGTDLEITSGPKLPIKVSYSAKLYSQYELPPASDSLVVGVIYPVLTAKTVAKKKAYEARDTVYVPHSPEFYVPEMLSAGSDYLSFLIQDAYDELRAKGIASRAYPDRLVVDVIDPYLVKSIAVIEHSDHRSLLGDDDPERTVGRFLVKLATNEDAAFDAAISSAGADGLVQFIPSTYALMVKKRPDLGLISDFRTGMADHKNAVKAQVAYLDMDLAGMSSVRDLYLSDRAKAGEYLAAAYNGGSTRVKRAYTAFGEDWDKSFKADLSAAQSDAAVLKKRMATLQKQIDAGKDVKASKAALAKAKREREEAVVKIATLNKSSLREETVFYVAKLKRAYGMFAAGYFATPQAPSGALPIQEAQPVAQTPASLASNASPAVQICFSEGGCSAVN